MLKSRNSYYELNYHIVFSTKNRIPFLDFEKLEMVRVIAKAKADSLGFLLYILNGYLDHIHLLVSIPPSIAIANVVKHIKGTSSKMIENLYWQRGYWVKVVEKINFDKVFNYVKNQVEHHQNNKLEFDWEYNYETESI
ncbi:MAG: hypothetical protein LDLANPLL_00024 [Turneriella sp.]|nr:hypothetical protein [Turneriella sp.]